MGAAGKRVRGVIFDLDNTLIDFMTSKRLAIRAAVDAMVGAGLSLPPTDVEKRIYGIYEEEGIEFQFVFDRLLEQALGRVDTRIKAAGIVAYRKMKDGALHLYPHVTETLIELVKRGIKLAVVSDAPRLQAWLRLYYFQLHAFFDVVVALEDTGKRKPDPAPFRMALERLSIEPGECMNIGDWPARDVVGGKNLGMVTVFAKYGDVFGVRESGADHTIGDIAQLVAVVDGRNGGPG